MDYIDRQQTLVELFTIHQRMRKQHDTEGVRGINEAIRAVTRMPHEEAELAPPRGEWRRKKGVWRCSVCGGIGLPKWIACPWCRARMRRKQDGT